MTAHAAHASSAARSAARARQGPAPARPHSRRPRRTTGPPPARCLGGQAPRQRSPVAVPPLPHRHGRRDGGPSHATGHQRPSDRQAIRALGRPKATCAAWLRRPSASRRRSSPREQAPVGSGQATHTRAAPVAAPAPKRPSTGWQRTARASAGSVGKTLLGSPAQGAPPSRCRVLLLARPASGTAEHAE